MFKIMANSMVTFFFIIFLSINSYGNDSNQETEPSSTNLALPTLLKNILENHEDIKNFESQVEAAEAQYRKARGQYYPKLDLQADGGREKIEREYSEDTEMNRYDIMLRANQLVTDFGKTAHTVNKSEIFLQQASARLVSKRQQILHEGIVAYINIVKTRDRLKSARMSEKRIKELTGIEETLVEKQAGLSSDVLQAKSQLAGAKALRVQAEGELNVAKNRFEALFFFTPDNFQLEKFTDIALPHSKLPGTMQDAVVLAYKHNPELLVTFYETQLAKNDIDIAKTAFYPQINLFAQAQKRDNDEGIKGYRDELSAGLELKYNFFRGGMDKAELHTALANNKAASYYTEFVRRIIKEQVSNSWEQLSIFKQRTELLRQQADIVENFLLLAKKERKMGTRSLLSVLNGEINFINATASAIAANQDTKIAAFNLFLAMGNINLELLE